MVMAAERVRSAPLQNADLSTLTDEEILDFEDAVCNDLNTATVLTKIDAILAASWLTDGKKLNGLIIAEQLLGLRLHQLEPDDFPPLTRINLRIRPKAAVITEDEIKELMDARDEARTAKDFAKSDAIRDDLIAKGVEVMDGDPLGWDWKLDV